MNLKIKQLSLIVPNKPGALAQVCEVLSQKNFNITTLTLADAESFGVLRLLIEDWENAKKTLEAAGLVVSATDVLAVAIPNHPGGLLEVLKLLENANVNVEYMYGFSTQDSSCHDCKAGAIQVLRLDNIERGIAALQSRIGIIEPVKLFH